MEDILCDVCFTNLKSGENNFKFCRECQDMLDRFCFCCDTIQAEPVDFICESCERDFDATCYMIDGSRLYATNNYRPYQWVTI